MRVIKFRQPLIDIKTKSFVGFHYWGCEETTFTNPANGGVYAKTGNLSDQFTGMHDINGNEIFESDIVKYTETTNFDYTRTVIEVVEYKKCGFTPFIYHYVCEGDGWYSVLVEDVKVIGNIYENPELINE